MVNAPKAKTARLVKSTMPTSTAKIDANPYDETLGSFKELITVIVVATAVGLLAYVVWGKL